MPDGTTVPTVNGGGPSAIDGPIVLCSRTDGDPARFFDGSIAQLGARTALELAASATAFYRFLWCLALVWSHSRLAPQQLIRLQYLGEVLEGVDHLSERSST